MDDQSTRVDRVDTRSTDQDQDHVLLKTNYNDEIICNMAASHAPIEWTCGAPEIIKHVP